MIEAGSYETSCSVCGRGLLPGERPTQYVTRDNARATVCELCRPRAEAAGWLTPEEAQAQGGMSRERRRSRGQVLSGLLARLPAAAEGRGAETGARGVAHGGGADTDGGPSGRAAGAGAAGQPRERRPPRRPAPAAEAEAEPAPAAGPASAEEALSERVAPAEPPATSVPEALAAFNASDHRRTVAGLTRTLGLPRATGLAIRTSRGYPGARITVAWEITWYQWEVGPGPDGPEVRESGKGETIDQLRAADRSWNLMADTDGTLEQRLAPPAGVPADTPR